jgi:hypothetical protein
VRTPAFSERPNTKFRLYYWCVMRRSGAKWPLHVVRDEFAVEVVSLREPVQCSHDFEGVLAANATDMTIRDNHVTQNDKALTLSNSGMPSFTGRASDLPIIFLLGGEFSFRQITIRN